MSGTARVPRGDESFCTLATATLVLVAASLSACSGDLQAGARQAPDSALTGAEHQESEGPSNLHGLVAHSARIAPASNWDGSLDGMKTLWFDSGAKRGEGRFVRGSKEGAWSFWYENGQERWEGTYQNDLVQGVERSWYPNGTHCYEGTSVDGRRHGEFRAWYEDGRLWWKGEYQLGVRQGPFSYWRRDGNPDDKVSGVYVNGKRTKGLASQGVALAEPD